MKKKTTKYILYSFSIIILLIVLLISAGYLLIRASLPQTEGTLYLQGLIEPVEITYDKMGIPQIWAKNERDGYFAFGYLHAADRMFQMDMTRRVAQGRLAELLGESVLFIDKQQRAVGHNRLAKKFLQKLSVENKMRLKAYANGINSFKNETSVLPFEYLLLGTEFEDWTVYDCISILSFQTWFSNFLMSPDAFKVKASEKAGIEKAAAMLAPYPGWAPYTIPQQPNRKQSSNFIQNAFSDWLIADGALPFLMSNSSNSWAVAPKLSESGSAIFASDPHLDVSSLPQFWYYLGLHITDSKKDILGISTPGLPFFTMGHNGKIAWAFTVAGIDINEYYIEKISDDSTQYLTPLGWRNFEIFEEVINVSGQESPINIRVKSTRHGPVMFEDDSLKQVYALRWAGFDIDLDRAVSAVFRLSGLDNFSDFRKAVISFGALDVNWTYADAKGNIGYQLGTPIPIRSRQTNNLPLPGWNDEFEWEGYRTLEETPHAFNPDRGWLATCNNKQDNANLDYDLQGTFVPDRILRITKLLESKEKFTVKDMQSFQMELQDDYLLRWKDDISGLLQNINRPALADKIKKWDGNAGPDSHEAALINLFLYNLKKGIFSDELGGKLTQIHNSDLENIYSNDAAGWFDNVKTSGQLETKKEIAQNALGKTLFALEGQTWGDLNSLTMAHPLSVVPLLSDMLGLKRGPFPWGGTPGTLSQSFYVPDKNREGYFTTHVAASWRFVIDFADIDGATIVIPSGNSGHPLSDHFMDFFDMWKNGGRWNVPFSYGKVKENAVGTLILKP